ncbi:MAG: hypothetical protein L6V93_01055 [Clostridiales bacterium]|nr:MAG: hypothetical protein L6V93_01055 [Clostridiales bacterium]
MRQKWRFLYGKRKLVKFADANLKQKSRTLKFAPECEKRTGGGTGRFDD